MARKQLSWREKEALMRERMLADPSIQEMVRAARAHRRYPDMPFQEDKIPWDNMTGFAALGAVLITPAVVSHFQNNPLTPTQSKILAILGGIGVIAVLYRAFQQEREYGRIPGTTLRVEQVGFKGGYPAFSPSLQRIMKLKPVQQMWNI